MPKSSRHKSHKQSKHSSKDLITDSEDAVKLEVKNNNREVAASARGSMESSHFSSGEKRKLSSSFQSKEGKDLSYSEEKSPSKVRKHKVERITGSGDRWTAGGDEENGSRAVEKEMCGQSLKLDVQKKGLKSRESKGSSALKSKSSRRHESEVEEHRGVSSVLKGKDEENRSDSTRCDSKRKSDKDSCRREGRESRDTKEKERVSNRDSEKIQEKKQESDARVRVMSVTKKRDSPSVDVDKDRLVKRGKENSELGTLDELCNPESVKELEKRIHRKVDGSGDRYKHEDGRENDYKKVLSKGDAAKDGKYKDERYKAGIHKEKYQDNIQKNNDRRDDKYREHAGGDRDSRRRDDKHCDGGEREHRREDRHRDDVNRDFKHWKDNGGDAQLRGDKYREDNDRENKHRDNKYLEGGKDNRRESRYYEDGDRVVGLKGEEHRRKNDRHNEEKRREDHEKDSEIRDGRHGDKFDKESRVKERNRSGDKSAATNLREGTFSSELLSRKSGVLDNSPSYDDRSGLKGAQGRKRTSEKDDCIDLKPRGFKDQRYDVEKRSTIDARVDLVTDRGRSGSKYEDVEATSVRNRHSPSSSSHVTRDQYRLLKQEDMKYREYAYEDRVEHNITSTKEYGNDAGVTEKISLSRSSDVIPKDDNLIGEVSAEKRIKSHTRNSPTSADERHYGRSHFRTSDGVEESGHRSGGSFKETNSYFHKDGRGSHDLASEICTGDEKAISVTSPYPRNSNLLNNSRSFPHPFPSPFRSADRHYNNRRNGDPNNMVRVQGSPWKGLPNWPSPLPNGFIPPFPLGPPPPPVGFHPSMQLFSGMRPSMELNHHHHHHPYPIPDNARYMGWRPPVYDPRPPPQLNGWEANGSSIGGESHFIVRQQHWRHGGPQSSKHVASLELLPGSEKGIHNLEGPMPHNSQQSNEEAKKDERTSHRFDEFVDASDNIVNEKIYVASEEFSEEEVNDVSKMSGKNDGLFCHAYLSMLDISTDLVDPDLYSRFKDMAVNVDEKLLSDSMDGKILYVEVSKDKIISGAEILSDSLFPTIGDSLFQKAKSLHNKHREGGFMRKEKHSSVTEKVKTAIEEGIHQDLIDEKSNEAVKVITNDSEILSEEKSRCKIENDVYMETGELPSKAQVTGSLNLLNVVSNKAMEEVVVVVVDDVVVVEDLRSDESVKISRIHHSTENTH